MVRKIIRSHVLDRVILTLASEMLSMIGPYLIV